MIFGTVISACYLPRAMILARSIKKHMPKSKIIVGLIEEEIPVSAFRFPYFDEVILMKYISPHSNYHKFFFQYTMQEAARACKAQVMKYMYNKFLIEDTIVYLDADMKVLGPFDELRAIVEKHPITIAGHYMYPETFDPDSLAEVRKSGIHHSGFVALKRHAVAEKYLHWWSKLSIHHGYFDQDKKRFADQDWLDLTQHFFDEVYLLRHAGYNVSSLNLIERWNINRIGEDYVIDNQPLRCLQFTPHLLQASSWIEPDKGKIYSELYYQYMSELKALELSDTGKKPWSYSCFSGGELITDETKRIFLKNYFENPEIENPFLLSNAYFNTDQTTENKVSLPIPLMPQKIVQKQSRAIPVGKTKAAPRKINTRQKKLTRRSV